MMPSASHSRTRTSHLAQLVNTTILHNDCVVIFWGRQNAENHSQFLKWYLISCLLLWRSLNVSWQGKMMGLVELEESQKPSMLIELIDWIIHTPALHHPAPSILFPYFQLKILPTKPSPCASASQLSKSLLHDSFFPRSIHELLHPGKCCTERHRQPDCRAQSSCSSWRRSWETQQSTTQ
jgi:hypothetical protein